MFEKTKQYKIKLSVSYGNTGSCTYMYFKRDVPVKLTGNDAEDYVFKLLIEEARSYGLRAGRTYVAPKSITQIRVLEFNQMIP